MRFSEQTRNALTKVAQSLQALRQLSFNQEQNLQSAPLPSPFPKDYISEELRAACQETMVSKTILGFYDLNCIIFCSIAGPQFFSIAENLTQRAELQFDQVREPKARLSIYMKTLFQMLYERQQDRENKDDFFNDPNTIDTLLYLIYIHIYHDNAWKMYTELQRTITYLSSLPLPETTKAILDFFSFKLHVLNPSKANPFNEKSEITNPLVFAMIGLSRPGFRSELASANSVLDEWITKSSPLAEEKQDRSGLALIKRSIQSDLAVHFIAYYPLLFPHIFSAKHIPYIVSRMQTLRQNHWFPSGFCAKAFPSKEIPKQGNYLVSELNDFYELLNFYTNHHSYTHAIGIKEQGTFDKHTLAVMTRKLGLIIHLKKETFSESLICQDAVYLMTHKGRPTYLEWTRCLLEILEYMTAHKYYLKPESHRAISIFMEHFFSIYKSLVENQMQPDANRLVAVLLVFLSTGIDLDNLFIQAQTLATDPAYGPLIQKNENLTSLCSIAPGWVQKLETCKEAIREGNLGKVLPQLVSNAFEKLKKTNAQMQKLQAVLQEEQKLPPPPVKIPKTSFTKSEPHIGPMENKLFSIFNTLATHVASQVKKPHEALISLQASLPNGPQNAALYGFYYELIQLRTKASIAEEKSAKQAKIDRLKIQESKTVLALNTIETHPYLKNFILKEDQPCRQIMIFLLYSQSSDGVDWQLIKTLRENWMPLLLNEKEKLHPLEYGLLEMLLYKWTHFAALSQSKATPPEPNNNAIWDLIKALKYHLRLQGSKPPLLPTLEGLDSLPLFLRLCIQDLVLGHCLEQMDSGSYEDTDFLHIIEILEQGAKQGYLPSCQKKEPAEDKSDFEKTSNQCSLLSKFQVLYEHTELMDIHFSLLSEEILHEPYPCPSWLNRIHLLSLQFCIIAKNNKGAELSEPVLRPLIENAKFVLKNYTNLNNSLGKQNSLSLLSGSLVLLNSLEDTQIRSLGIQCEVYDEMLCLMLHLGAEAKQIKEILATIGKVYLPPEETACITELSSILEPILQCFYAATSPADLNLCLSQMATLNGDLPSSLGAFKQACPFSVKSLIEILKNTDIIAQNYAALSKKQKKPHKEKYFQLQKNVLQMAILLDADKDAINKIIAGLKLDEAFYAKRDAALFSKETKKEIPLQHKKSKRKPKQPVDTQGSLPLETTTITTTATTITEQRKKESLSEEKPQEVGGGGTPESKEEAAPAAPQQEPKDPAPKTEIGLSEFKADVFHLNPHLFFELAEACLPNPRLPINNALQWLLNNISIPNTRSILQSFMAKNDLYIKKALESALSQFEIMRVVLTYNRLGLIYGMSGLDRKAIKATVAELDSVCNATDSAETKAMQVIGFILGHIHAYRKYFKNLDGSPSLTDAYQMHKLGALFPDCQAHFASIEDYFSAKPRNLRLFIDGSFEGFLGNIDAYYRNLYEQQSQAQITAAQEPCHPYPTPPYNPAPMSYYQPQPFYTPYLPSPMGYGPALHCPYPYPYQHPQVPLSSQPSRPIPNAMNPMAFFSQSMPAAAVPTRATYPTPQPSMPMPQQFLYRWNG